MNRRKVVITKEWLADFYANGVEGKYKASVKKAAKEEKKKGGKNEGLPKTKSL
jgi:hypothetical protein